MFKNVSARLTTCKVIACRNHERRDAITPFLSAEAIHQDERFFFTGESNLTLRHPAIERDLPKAIKNGRSV